MLRLKGLAMNKKTLVAALLAGLAVAPAFAKGGHDDHRGRGRGHDDHYGYVDRDCPPGLAKKHNGCMPPGQAKKAYPRVGYRVPADAVYVIPRHVRATLPPPPYGYRYAVVNNQVVLVSDANIIVDIVRSLLG